MQPNSEEFLHSTAFGVLLTWQLLHALWREMERNYESTV